MEEIWEAHVEAKKEMVNYVNRTSSHIIDPDVFTIGFARRATAYKRPNLVFADTDRLVQVARTVGRIQFIFAGKAHPKDGRERS